MKKPLIIAHRGSSYDLPGNTLPAIQKAIKEGADVIEVDLRRTRDGEIILAHNKIGREDLAPTMAMRPFCPPTLKEVFERVPKKTVFYLDIKELGMVEDVKKIARQAHMDEVWYSNKQSLIFAYTPLLYYYPFVPVTLHKIAASAPRQARGYGEPKDMPCFIVERACLMYYEHVPSLVRLVHGLGRKLWVWGVNTKHEMEKWIEIGADGILTDRPKLLKDLLKFSENSENSEGRSSRRSEIQKV